MIVRINEQKIYLCLLIKQKQKNYLKYKIQIKNLDQMIHATVEVEKNLRSVIEKMNKNIKTLQ